MADVRRIIQAAATVFISTFVGLTDTGRVEAGMIDKDGMQPWEICGMCHSLDGVSAMAKFPKLAGQRAAYIKKQFKDFHAGNRENDGGQMQAITTEVEPDTLDAIADYFANLPAPDPQPGSGASGTVARNLFLYGRSDVEACAFCHDGRGGSAAGAVAPWLEAQHRDYIAKQLMDFRTGARANDPEGVMRSIAARLEPSEIDALASYLAAEKRPDRRP